MAFFGGSTGVIYRQFSVTIVSAMALSILVALVLSPALCATLLKPVGRRRPSQARPLLRLVQPQFRRASATGIAARTGLVPAPHLAGSWSPMPASSALLALLFVRLPTGFLPDEDQGFIISLITLPAGATQPRTMAVAQAGRPIFPRQTRRTMWTSSSPWRASASAGAGQNTGMAFTHLKDWSERKGAQNSAAAIAQRAIRHFFPHPRRPGLRPRAARGAGAGQCHRLRPRAGGPRQSRPCRR